MVGRAVVELPLQTARISSPRQEEIANQARRSTRKQNRMMTTSKKAFILGLVKVFRRRPQEARKEERIIRRKVRAVEILTSPRGLIRHGINTNDNNAVSKLTRPGHKLSDHI